MDSNFKHRSVDDEVINLPYHGGLAGHVLQITRNPDGSTTSNVVRREDINDPNVYSFENNLRRIQSAAAHLVSIQDSAKKRGAFSNDDSKTYANNLHQLGVAAQNLAKLQEKGFVQDFRDLFAPPSQDDVTPNRIDATKLPDMVESSIANNEATNYGDTIQVTAKESTVAEAKPVGLSIAGPGGVASSKPVATAIAGADGLAISRPIATAISGVSPEDVQALGVGIPDKKVKKGHSEMIIRGPSSDLGKYMLTHHGVLAKVDKNTSTKKEIKVEERFDEVNDDTKNLKPIIELDGDVTEDNITVESNNKNDPKPNPRPNPRPNPNQNVKQFQFSFPQIPQVADIPSIPFNFDSISLPAVPSFDSFSLPAAPSFDSFSLPAAPTFDFGTLPSFPGRNTGSFSIAPKLIEYPKNNYPKFIYTG